MVASTTFFTLTTSGLVGYLFVLSAMWKYRKEFHQKHNFYYLVWHLATADLGMFLALYVVAIPISFTGRPIYGEGVLLISLATMDTLFFFLVAFTSFLIALNRFCCFFATRLYDKLSTKRGLLYQIAIGKGNAPSGHVALLLFLFTVNDDTRYFSLWQSSSSSSSCY